MYYYDIEDDASKCSPSCMHDSCKGHCHGGKHGEFCVEEILAGILKAQRKVEKEDKKDDSSCDKSIGDLLKGPTKYRKNTIPFILYCGCKPFKGIGATTYRSRSKDIKFISVTSYVFRIKELKGKCAQLELLMFKSKKCPNKKFCSPEEQINHQSVKDLVRTGICIDVDLSCFCGVTYLPAVRL